jgi:hypothetical protein
MLIWQDKYAKDEGFSARYFANEVAALTHNKVAPKQILISVIAELTSNKNHAEDPAPLINQYRFNQQRSSNQFFKLPELEAFTVLTQKILSLCPESVQRSLRLSMMTNIAHLSIDANLSLQVMRWFGDHTLAINASSVNLKDLRQLVSLLYGELCEAIGPVKSDNLLATALQRLENNGGAIYSDLFKKML